MRREPWAGFLLWLYSIPEALSPLQRLHVGCPGETEDSHLFNAALGHHKVNWFYSEAAYVAGGPDCPTSYARLLP